MPNDPFTGVPDVCQMDIVRRMKAAYKACKGIPTEVLETLGDEVLLATLSTRVRMMARKKHPLPDWVKPKS